MPPGMIQTTGLDMANNHKRRLTTDKAFLDWHAGEKLRRATLARHRKLRVYQTRDMVYYWWDPQGTGGSYIGPARVLAIETSRTRTL